MYKHIIRLHDGLNYIEWLCFCDLNVFIGNVVYCYSIVFLYFHSYIAFFWNVRGLEMLNISVAVWKEDYDLFASRTMQFMILESSFIETKAKSIERNKKNIEKKSVDGMHIHNN